MSENKYPIGGYAPGSYTCICCICKNEFQGDKQALQCEECALKAIDSEARAQSPTFDEMIGLIEKLFKDYLTDIGKICTPEEIEKGWQRYKVLNHLYQDGQAIGGYVSLPANDAVQNWFEENIDKECSASSAIYKFRLWLESLQPQPAGAVWVKGPPMEPKKHFAKVQGWLDDNVVNMAIIVPVEGSEHWWAYGKHFGYTLHGSKVIEHLQEIGTACNNDATGQDLADGKELTRYYQDIEKTAIQNIIAALRKFVSMHETGLLPNKFIYEEGKKALGGIGENNDAIKFAEWIYKYYVRCDITGKWKEALRVSKNRYTTAELFQLWQQSKSK